MSVIRSLDGLVIRDERLRGGRPILAGTGVTVRTVVGHYRLGLTAEEIADEMGLDLALVYAALTYYHLHRDEIEADILANMEVVLQPLTNTLFDLRGSVPVTGPQDFAAVRDQVIREHARKVVQGED